MTDQPTQAVPPAPAGGEPPVQPERPTPPPERARRWFETKRVLLPVVALIGFLMGVGTGGTATETTQQQTSEASSPTASDEADAAQEALEALEEERDTWRGRAEEQEAELERLHAELAAAEERAASEPAEEPEVEPASEPEPEPREPARDEDAEAGPGAPDTYTAGAYEFSDVQVRPDFVGDFELRARVTNTGGADRTGVSWTASVFSDGSVVATLTGFASDFASGTTITVEFISTDDYRDDWDTIEFQVDAEF